MQYFVTSDDPLSLDRDPLCVWVMSLSSYFQEAGSDATYVPCGPIALIERLQFARFIFQALVMTDIGGGLTIVVIGGNRDFLRCAKGSGCRHSDPVIDNDSKSKTASTTRTNTTSTRPLSPFYVHSIVPRIT